jgi:hypothetical protein
LIEKRSVRFRRARVPRVLRFGCFGDFRSEDRICRRHCAIRIRCAVERDQKIYVEVCEEMAEVDRRMMKFQ